MAFPDVELRDNGTPTFDVAVSSGAPPASSVFKLVANTAMPQVADYRMLAGFALVIASAVTPQGKANASEYRHGTHAVAIHAAEAVKSQVWKSQQTPPVTAASVPRFIFAPAQFYADVPPRAIFPSLVAGATPRPIPLVSGAPQLADLTLQASIKTPLTSPQGPTVRQFVGGPLQVDLTQQAQFNVPPAQRQGPVPPPTTAAPQLADLTLQALLSKPLTTPQGRVPPAVVVPPQTDPSQIAAKLWASQPAAAIVANPVAPFFAVPPQTEERPTRQVWPSQLAGKTPPVIASLWAAPQQYDFTQQAVIVLPSVTPVVAPYKSHYGAPQLVDLTQQGWILGTAPGRQGPVPPSVWAPQADPTQIQAKVWPALRTPPAPVQGPVPPLIFAWQWDRSQIDARLWSPLVAAPPPPTAGRITRPMPGEDGSRPSQTGGSRPGAIDKTRR